jgi:N-acetylmuramoyl-L-alanine amidase
MTPLDQISLALMMWKENRAGGIAGMQSCGNVAINRTAARGMSVYAVVYQPMQFSSMSAPHDPQLLIQPAEDDPEWEQAQSLAVKAATGNLPDITGGALSYYALSMVQPPWWASSMVPTVIIANQRFLRWAMDQAVEIAWISMCGSVLSAALAAAAVWLGTKNKNTLVEITAKVDGQLTEVIALRDAVAFGKGEDKQRDKQTIKDAVAAGIKQANGPKQE